MGFFDIFRRKEERDKFSDFVTFKDMTWPAPTHAGTVVTQDTAANLPAVFRCWSLNADTISSLPVDFVVKRGGKRLSYDEPLWYREPNDFQDWGQFIAQVQLSFEADGNAFILKASTPTGALAGLYPLAPNTVEPKLLSDGRVVYEVAKKEGGSDTYSSTAMIHIRGITPAGSLRGLSPVECARQALGMAFAAEQYGAQYFGTGATLSGVIITQKTMEPEVAERLAEAFQRKHGGVSKSHAVGVLSGGADWKPISVNPNDSQFLETRRFTDVQIAQLYGVPPEYVTDAEGAKGFVTGLYARQYMWLQTGINPRLVRLERAFSSLLPGDAYMKFNRNAFLQMDPKERVDYYAAGIRDRWLVPNNAREKEDMDPLPGGDEPLWSVQWQDGAPGNEVPPE